MVRRETIDRINQLHRAFAALNLGSGFAGLAFRETAPIGLNVVLMTVLLVMLRAKFWFDDEAYFEDVANGKLPGGIAFAIGVILAVGSWIAWTFAGFYIKDIELVSILMVHCLCPLYILDPSLRWPLVAHMLSRYRGCSSMSSMASALPSSSRGRDRGTRSTVTWRDTPRQS
jgi:hypothetical protein